MKPPMRRSDSAGELRQSFWSDVKKADAQHDALQTQHTMQTVYTGYQNAVDGSALLFLCGVEIRDDEYDVT